MRINQAHVVMEMVMSIPAKIEFMDSSDLELLDTALGDMRQRAEPIARGFAASVQSLVSGEIAQRREEKAAKEGEGS